MYVEKLPCRGKFVFARVGGVDYGEGWKRSRPIVFRNDGAGGEERVEVDVLRPKATKGAAGGKGGKGGDGKGSDGKGGVDDESAHSVEYIALSHPMFLERTRQSIYPDSRVPEKVSSRSATPSVAFFVLRLTFHALGFARALLMTKFIKFKSLWNRCIADLIIRYALSL